MDQIPFGYEVKKRDRGFFWIIISIFSLFFIGFIIISALIFSLFLLVAGEDEQNLFKKPNIGVLEIKDVIYDSKGALKFLRRVRENDDIKALILRVDSPGGAVAPSQEIFEEIKKLKKIKKVVASFGAVAASGGYYVAASCDWIVANPGTITGSIGVIMNVANTEELLSWAKIKHKAIKSGKFKDIGSPFRKMTTDEEKLLTGVIDDVFDQFVSDISDGRRIPKEKILEFADGRIFSGKEAVKLGLVDQLGNFESAIESAVKLSGIEDDPVLLYPEKRPKFVENLFSKFYSFLGFENFLSRQNFFIGYLLDPIMETR